MGDYRLQDARFTMIIERRPQAGGKDLYVRLPFELVRYNVDTDPDVTPVIVPVAASSQSVPPSGTKPDEKIYENIWFVDAAPWRPGADGRVHFGGIV